MFLANNSQYFSLKRDLNVLKKMGISPKYQPWSNPIFLMAFYDLPVLFGAESSVTESHGV